MCRRSGGSVCETLVFTLFSGMMLAGAAGTAGAQELPATITTLIEQLAEQGGDAEELVRYYEELMQQPLNVNAASRAQLEECGLLTLFQVESLLAWRERYGALRSATELGLVEGFTPEDAKALRAFFTFGDAAPAVPTKQTYSAKFRKKWEQQGFSLTGKGVYEAPDWSAGVTIDNDPKERFPDFWSVSARYKGLYAGDFTARFGQGLVLWKSFSLSAFGTPSSTSRRGAGLREYRGTDESNFFRGLGWTQRFKAFTVTAFASYNAVDARIVDGRYTSIATDGLHATETERAKRHAMHEWVAGANVAWQKGRWHLGVTAVGYGYDKPNGRRVQDYNRYQQYDGAWGNLGLDWYGTLGSLRLFGEAAVDAHRAPAALAGALWSPSYNFETSLTLRCYAPAYIATHAGAYSSLSSVSNQLGTAYALQWIRGRWTLRLNADYAYYPWKRYRAEAGTSGLKARLQVLRSFRSGAEGEVQFSWSSRLKARLRLTQPLGDRWTLSARADANIAVPPAASSAEAPAPSAGLGGYLDARWHPNRRWDVSARVTAWCTTDWDARLCFYERGVPQSFAVENYSGKGIGAYLTVKYAPTRHIEMWLKIQQGFVAYFVRIFMPGLRTLLALRPLSL